MVAINVFIYLKNIEIFIINISFMSYTWDSFWWEKKMSIQPIITDENRFKSVSQAKNTSELQHFSDNKEIIPKKKLVAIPCFNEEKTIGSVILRARRYADEILVIDDGSTDKTAEIAKEAGATVMQHGGNRGYGVAIQSCFTYAKDYDYDVLTILDGDGQHNPDDLLSVMQPVLDNKADISIGSRFLDETRKRVPMYRRFGIWMLTRFTNAGIDEKNHRVIDTQSGFRTYSRRAIETIDPKETNMGVTSEILMQGRKHNLYFTEIPISVSYEGDTSTQDPMRHGFGVIVSILQYLEVEHALLFFGIPALVLFIAGLFFGFQEYLSYSIYHYVRLSYALIAVACLLLSMLFGMTGLILHAVLNASRRR